MWEIHIQMVRTLSGGPLHWSRFSFIKEPKRQYFQKMFNKLFLKYYIVSDTDHIYSGNVFITEDEKVLEEDINLFKPMEFRKSCSPNDELNKLNNLWNKLPDEIGKTILLNAIGSSSNAIQDYHSIMQTCSTFQIVKQKGKSLLPRVYIDTHEKWEHLVTETWSRSMFGNWQNCLVKIADFY